MKKNLIALAVSAAMVAPVVVMADATVYGIGQAELTNFDPQKDGADSTTAIHDNGANARIGAKASEDLGNGLTAIAVMEFKVDTTDGNVDSVKCSSSLTFDETVNNIDYNGDGDTTDTAVKIEDTVDNDAKLGCSATGAAALAGREAMVGLKGSFGTAMIGRLKQPYKYTGGVGYDAFVATALQARGAGGMSGNVGGGNAYGHGGFASNSLGYVNKFGPVDVKVNYQPDTDKTGMMAAATYMADNFEVFVALADYSGADGDADDYAATKFGGKFTTGPHSIMLQIEDTKTAGDLKVGYTFLGYQMKMGMNTLVLQYGMEDVKDVDDANSTYLALGAYHNFSKMSSIFGGYRNTDADAKDGEAAITVGLRQKF
jgi:predicted porin